jgi:S1-C subfamily serine protease
MTLDPRRTFLRDRAARALGNHTVAAAVKKVKAIIGPENIPPSEPLAQAAFNKLHNGEEPTADELVALEIVIRLLRPVVFSHNGVLDDLPDRPEENLQPQELKDLWSAFREKVRSLVGSIGRVESTLGDRPPEHVGTGFLADEGLLATNRHVLSVLTLGTEVLVRGRARVVFKQEDGETNKRRDIIAIEGVAATHPNLDIVLLKVSAAGRPAFDVAQAASVAEGERVVTIGYPGKDQRNNPLFLDGVFNGRFGVKRAALGEVLDGVAPPVFFHDCSTTQGNSGSPILSLVDGNVAGIHRAGFFMYRNEGVDGPSLRTFIAGAKR